MAAAPVISCGDWVGFLRNGICSRSGFGFSDANKTIHESSLRNGYICIVSKKDVSLNTYFKMALKNLPLGISTLSFLLELNCIYVDKTEYAFNLIKSPGRFFLSRPRRFGKSLFVDTLKEIFEGNQKLFEGLYIHDKWDWTKKYPVIKLDFAGGEVRNREELDVRITEYIEEEWGTTWGYF